MRFGKYVFESFKEFQEIRDKSLKAGMVTIEEFSKFLSCNYSHKLVNN